ncbi:MAG: DUF262 domain-containing protein [Muribaculaceae bacterium]|nr:DUF262 domain-containing protein [Muribaculaceae bacterium]
MSNPSANPDSLNKAQPSPDINSAKASLPSSEDKSLKVRSVNSFRETFHIPPFQRGYRWERKQVKTLLDDLNEHIYKHPKDPYYLQPIVVAPRADGSFDLIDGQQRLTTLYIIKKYLAQRKRHFELALETLGPSSGIMNPLETQNPEPTFSLDFATRTDSAEFLENIANKSIQEAGIFPDYLYMWHVYDMVKKWFETEEWEEEGIAKKGHPDRLGVIADFIDNGVKLIWYTLGPSADPWKKFAELNIGKIPLTNSELVKALFLSDDNKEMTEDQKATLVQQWDSMERELNDKNFWAFLTENKMEDYDTKIDLIFDIIARKKWDEKDEYYTFLEFDKKFKKEAKNRPGKEKWDEIYLQYLRLRDWYLDPNNENYHKVGYLVATGFDLQDIFNESKKENMTATEFRIYLNEKIKEQVKFDGRLEDLRYNKHDALIHRILLLFNVMTMHAKGEPTQRYSFSGHKNAKGGWSLEHIHAQNSEELNTVNQWKAWTANHIKILNRFVNHLKLNKPEDKKDIEAAGKLLSDMKTYRDELLKDSKLSGAGDTFRDISNRFRLIYTDPTDSRTSDDYKDELANLALLERDANSCLNNSVFGVKRNLIIEKENEYFIPICTRNVFLKAYSDSEDTDQFFFWGDEDRKSYLKEIKRVLKDYLPPEALKEEKKDNAGGDISDREDTNDDNSENENNSEEISSSDVDSVDETTTQEN